MSGPLPRHRTHYRPGPLWAGGVVVCVALGLLGTWLARLDALPLVLAPAGLLTVGWGAFADVALSSLTFLAQKGLLKGALPHLGLLGGGVAALAAGVALLAAGIRTETLPEEAPSPAVGAKLHPSLARYRDFYWGTLAAYGGGILLAEVMLVLCQLLLANVVRMPPVPALGISALLAVSLAFAAGFLGSAWARRLSVPEATLGILYFGTPLPLFFTLLHHLPPLQLAWGYRLREVTYLAELLGNRPELGYWLVFAALVLFLVLGMTTGFVITASGRADLRTGYELFIAQRHVSVFRPRLLLGGLAVLLLLVIPPLLIYFMVRAAEGAVEKTRVKALGLADPLAATAELHRSKLREMTPTGMMTALSVGGVGLGVWALIVVLSVMSGFEIDLQQKILGTNAHAVVSKYTGDVPEYPELLPKIRAVRGVTGATPFILNQVMITSEGNIDGVIIKGIDPDSVDEVTDLRKNTSPPEAVGHLDTPEKIRSRRISVKDSGAIDGRPATEKGRSGLFDPDRAAAARGSGADAEAEADDRGLTDEDIIGRPSGSADAPAPGPAPKQAPKPPPSAAKDEDALSDDDIIGKPLPLEVNARAGAEGAATGSTLPGILLGKELATSLRVVVGDRVNVVSPLGELGPQGPIPKSRPFRVAGIVYTGMYEYDSKFVYIQLEEAQSFFGVKGASGIELKVGDIDDARRIARSVVQALDGYPYRARDWGEMNKNLFSALRLEKLVMGIILSIIVVVAAGMIVATVIMLVLEKRKEIAVLKALGVPDGGIVKIFLAEGLQIGVAGGLLGLVSGLAWCLFIDKVGIHLNPEVYYIPRLPVKIEPIQTAVAVLIAILVTYLGSIYPALKASRVEPVEGLKAE